VSGGEGRLFGSFEEDDVGSDLEHFTGYPLAKVCQDIQCCKFQEFL
jgi:hypothetical protein